MAARKTTNVPFTLFTLRPEVEPIYKKALSILKKQREVDNSELAIVATYANQIYLNQRAMDSVIIDGALMINRTAHGEKLIENPMNKVANTTAIQIAKYADILGLSAKSKNDLVGETDEEDEDDPLSNLIKKRGKK
ncbi:hypothetical protein E4630_12160 [Aeromonas hydrophila]|uniref:P27 family phage terminase small subunit n=1 Tax=Aeromonas hydrophila TaxID=644 RepID=UPI00107E7064|nr:P27 family phage terminase small subunit [Aeromonas hydrophila]QBX71554.1 hypothetical protein E4625_12380 [Aeromonas hydrophila]QBX76254.1 hypothetical protein E4630_12160 [Aeromonas hydrophila]